MCCRTFPKGNIAVRLEPDRHRDVGAGLRDQSAGRSEPAVRRRAERVVADPRERQLAADAGARHVRAGDRRYAQPGQAPTTSAAFSGWRSIPGFNTLGSPGFRTLYTYEPELIPAGTAPTYPDSRTPPRRTTRTGRNEWKMSGADPNVVDPASRREIISFGKERGQSQRRHDRVRSGRLSVSGDGDGGNANDVGASHIEPGGNAQNLTTPLGKMLRIDPLDPVADAGQRRRRQRQRPVSHSGDQSVPGRGPGAGDLRLRPAQSVSLCVRHARTAS